MKPVPMIDVWLFERFMFEFYGANSGNPPDWFPLGPSVDELRQCLTMENIFPEGYRDVFSPIWLLEEPFGADRASADTWGADKGRALRTLMDVVKAATIGMPYSGASDNFVEWALPEGAPDVQWRDIVFPGVGLVPAISCDGGFARETGKGFVPVDIFEYEISDEYRPYVDFINDNLDEFPHVLIGYWGTESGAYDKWVKGESYNDIYVKMGEDDHYAINQMIAELEKMKSLYPDIFASGKACVMPSDIAFESEARLYEGRLAEAPLLNWCKDNNVLIILCRAFWVLESRRERHRTVEDNSSPVMTYVRDKPYPYDYFKDYISEHAFWTGLGQMEGAKRGYFDSLMDFGFEGVYTYMPKKYQGEDEKFDLLSGLT